MSNYFQSIKDERVEINDLEDQIICGPFYNGVESEKVDLYFYQKVYYEIGMKKYNGYEITKEVYQNLSQKMETNNVFGFTIEKNKVDKKIIHDGFSLVENELFKNDGSIEPLYFCRFNFKNKNYHEFEITKEIYEQLQSDLK